MFTGKILFRNCLADSPNLSVDVICHKVERLYNLHNQVTNTEDETTRLYLGTHSEFNLTFPVAHISDQNPGPIKTLPNRIYSICIVIYVYMLGICGCNTFRKACNPSQNILRPACKFIELTIL